MPKKRVRSSSLGQILKAGNRYKARYEHAGVLHTPGVTFASWELADRWLLDEHDLIHDRNRTWTPPAVRRADAAQKEERATTTFDAYARDYIDKRRVRDGDPLAPRTRSEYLRYLDGILKPFAAKAVVDITPGMVDAWWAEHDDVRPYRQKSYSFLKQVLAHAITARGGALITVNPCQVENASYVTKVTPDAVRDQRIVNLTPAAIAALAEGVEPRWAALVLVLAYTAMRPGEAFALRRSNITMTERDGLSCWCLHVGAAATTSTDADGNTVRVIGKTKTAQSVRYVYLPPHLVDPLQAHLATHAAPGPDGLVFPNAPTDTTPATIQQVWGTSKTNRREPSGFHRARLLVGSPELTVYDLRRWGRRILRRAGMSDLDVEQYMGHQLGRVTDAYAVVDPEMVWTVMVKASELAGWTKPIPSAPALPAAQHEGLPIPARLLNAMTPAQLAGVLEGMDEDALAVVVPQLEPSAIARLLASGLWAGSSEGVAR